VNGAGRHRLTNRGRRPPTSRERTRPAHAKVGLDARLRSRPSRRRRAESQLGNREGHEATESGDAQCTFSASGFPSAASRRYFAGTLADQTAPRITDVKPEHEGIRERTIAGSREGDVQLPVYRRSHTIRPHRTIGRDTTNWTSMSWTAGVTSSSYIAQQITLPYWA